MYRMRNKKFLDLLSLQSSINELESKSDKYVTREEIELSEYSLQIFSSNGWYFTNGRVDTDLTVICLKGKEDVTSTIPPERFKWTRKTSDVVKDEEWNKQDIRGKYLTISERDILKGKNTTFICSLLDEEDNVILSTN